MAAGTSAMFLTGGGLALASTALPGAPTSGLVEVRWLAGSALVIGLLLPVVGRRLPRWAFHLVLVTALALITRGVWVAGDELSSATYALLYLLVVVNAFSAASWSAAGAHLVLALTGVAVTLGLLPEARPAMIVVVAGVLVAICTYTGRLVRAAGSAEVDALTGLVNRRGLDRRLDAELERVERTGAPLSVAVIDLDGFKRVNDAQGHAAGDRLLQEVARAWSAQIPPGMLLARPGGDEFVVVAPTGPAVLEALSARLRESLPALVGCSAGVAAHVRGHSASTLIGRADEALYAVKRSSRGSTAVASDPAGSGNPSPVPFPPLVPPLAQPVSSTATSWTASHPVPTEPVSARTEPCTAHGIDPRALQAHTGAGSVALALAGLAGAAVLILVLVLDGVARGVLVAAVAAAAAVVPAACAVLRRLPDRGAWLLLSLMLGLWALNAVTSVLGGPERLSLAAASAGQVVAVLLVVRLAAIRTGARGPAGPHTSTARAARTGWRSSTWWNTGTLVLNWAWRRQRRDVDAVLLAAVTAGVIAQQVASLAGRPTSTWTWVDVVPPVDVLLAAVLVRFTVSRARLSPAVLMLLLASVTTIGYDLLVTATGHRVLPADHPVHAVYVVAALLFALAAAHPSAAVPLAVSLAHRRRSRSARLQGMVPLAAVPLALHLLPSGSSVPAWVHVGAGAAIAAAGLLLASAGVRAAERSAGRDGLTGLLNRRGLHRALQDLREQGHQSIRLTLLDLVAFSHINDTVGHDGGDRLLAAVGTRLQQRPGPGSAVARTSGDHFAVLTTHDGNGNGNGNGEGEGRGQPVWLASCFSTAFEVFGRQQHLAATAGIVDVDAGADLSAALADAEVALHHAKATGAPAVVYRAELRAAVRRRLDLAADLQRLLHPEDHPDDADTGAALDAGALDDAGGTGDATGPGRLVVHYQPLVDLDDGWAVGVEALVRWHHPHYGLIAPDDFLTIAEDYELGAALDRWVLRTAAHQVACWRQQLGRPLFLSANLGRSSMLDADLAAQTRLVLAEAGLAADLLHLEITEHDQLPAGAGAEALAALALDGVRVSLDDFGTGWTSLDYLQRYPITTLKLDRSVSHVLQVQERSSLVSGITALADSLGIPVLVEGIETVEQRVRAARAGARYGQGYWFCRPLPAEDVLAVLIHRAPAAPVT